MWVSWRASRNDFPFFIPLASINAFNLGKLAEVIFKVNVVYWRISTTAKNKTPSKNLDVQTNGVENRVAAAFPSSRAGIGGRWEAEVCFRAYGPKKRKSYLCHLKKM